MQVYSSFRHSSFFLRFQKVLGLITDTQCFLRVKLSLTCTRVAIASFYNIRTGWITSTHHSSYHENPEAYIWRYPCLASLLSERIASKISRSYNFLLLDMELLDVTCVHISSYDISTDERC